MTNTAPGTPLTGNLLYADNLKFDAKAPRQLHQLIKIVKMFKCTEKWNLVRSVVGLFYVRRDKGGTERVRDETRRDNRASECYGWLPISWCAAV